MIQEIKALKKYLWKHIDEHTKELIVPISTTNTFKDKAIELDTISIGYQYK